MTLSMIDITISGGTMVRKLSARDAMKRSLERLLLPHHHAEQPAEGEGRIGLDAAALGAQQDGLAAPDLGEPHFVDHDRRFGFRRARVFQATILASGLAPVSSPAVPSLNSRTTGPVLLRFIRWRQRSRSARDHMPAFLAQSERAAALGTVSPGSIAEFARIEFQPEITGRHHHRQQTRMDRRTARRALGSVRLPRHARFRGPKREREPDAPTTIGRACVRQKYPRANPLCAMSLLRFRSRMCDKSGVQWGGASTKALAASAILSV